MPPPNSPRRRGSAAKTDTDPPSAPAGDQPAETKPAETKPAETKPAETKPAGTQAAGDQATGETTADGAAGEQAAQPARQPLSGAEQAALRRKLRDKFH
jgi:hypothetical protein